MNDAKSNSPISAVIEQASGYIRQLGRYRLVLFIILVAVLYGFLVYRISALNGQQPPQDAVDSQVQALNTPRIDQHVLSQLQSLQDNSVSVHALFDQARSNPFQ